MNRPSSGKQGLIGEGSGIRLLFALVFLFYGAYGNYLPVWLRAEGWDGSEIGWLGGMRTSALLAFPLFWGFLIDRSGHPVRILQIVTFGSALAFVPVLLSTSPWVILPMMLAFGFFSVGTVPALDALSLRHVARSGGDYGHIRIWGSAGFVVGGFLLGGLIELSSRDAVPWTLVGTLFAATALVLFLPRVRYTHGDRTPLWPTLRRLLKRRRMRAFYLVTLFNRAAAQGVMLFLTLHLEDIGVSDAAIPWYWTVGVIAEIYLLRVAGRLLEGRNRGCVIALCCAVAAAQYGLMAAVLDPGWLLPILAGHGVSFGLWYYASVTFIAKHVDDADRTTAQGLFQSVGFGLGGVIASIGAGYLFEAGGGPLLFAVCAGLQALTAGLALWVFRPPRSC